MLSKALATFKDRKIFLTGHTGFKGAWLALWLHELGAEVHGFALPPSTQPNLFELLDLKRLHASHTEADLRDFPAVQKALNAARPDCVFHLAAQALVREGYRTPRETFDTNVMGTVNLLEAVREQTRACSVVVVTSDKCYENREHPAGYSEEDPMGGFDPYSASKGAAELVVAAFRRSFFPPADAARHGVRLASARAGNVIGGGDWAENRIMVDCVRALAAGRPIGVRNPRSVRPWQHVLEPLGGYLLLGSRLAAAGGEAFAEGWNFGPAGEDVKTVRELVEAVIQAWGSGRWENTGDLAAPHEAALLALNCRKARERLNWTGRWDFATAVRQTVAWYKAWHEGRENLMALTCAQIKTYSTAS